MKRHLFFAKVNKRGRKMPHMRTHCHEWTGATMNGYGSGFSRGKTRQAHRIAWYVYTGSDPEPGKMVLHKCDNRRCVRRSHLRVGTHQDNMDDMKSRDLHRTLVPRGEDAPWSKLGRRDVRRIRRTRRLMGATYTQLAKQFDVHPGTIADVVKRRTWAHVGDM